MPDIVYNKLEFQGITDKQFQRIIMSYTRDVEGANVLSFDILIPEPEGLRDPDNPKHLTPAMHEWRLANWGTKWNAWMDTEDYGNSIDEENHTLYFHTAWSPPLPVIVKLGELLQVPLVLKFTSETIGRGSGVYTVKGNDTIYEYETELDAVLGIYAEVTRTDIDIVREMYTAYTDECKDEE